MFDYLKLCVHLCHHANITMEHTEEQALNSFQPQPKIFLRYSQRLFFDRQEMLSHEFPLSSKFHRIRISFTLEISDSLPFSQVLVS